MVFIFITLSGICVCRKNVIFYFSGICPLLALRNTGPRPKQVVFLDLLGRFTAHAKLSRYHLPLMGP